MALEMRTKCERCGRDLSLRDEAYICSYECTFLRKLFERNESVCPNCRGELVRGRGVKAGNDKSRRMNPQGVEPCGSLHGSVRRPIRPLIPFLGFASSRICFGRQLI